MVSVCGYPWEEEQLLAVSANIDVSPAHSPPGGCYFFLDKKVTKKSREKNASTLPAIFAFGAAKAKIGIPATAGPLFSQPHALCMTFSSPTTSRFRKKPGRRLKKERNKQ